LSQVDVANFGRKAWRDWIDGDGHDHVLGARGFIGVGRIESRWTTACNRLGKILKPGRRGSEQRKSRSRPAFDRRNARASAASLASVQLLRVRTYGRGRRGGPARFCWARGNVTGRKLPGEISPLRATLLSKPNSRWMRFGFRRPAPRAAPGGNAI